MPTQTEVFAAPGEELILCITCPFLQRAPMGELSLKHAGVCRRLPKPELKGIKAYCGEHPEYKRRLSTLNVPTVYARIIGGMP